MGYWTQVEERYLSRPFQEARDAVGSTREGRGNARLSEMRALSLHLSQKAGKNGRKIAEHVSETMTKNYQKDHAEIVWAGAIPDLNISGITG